MSEVKNYSLSDLANSLATASKIAKELQIDISAQGFWRKVIISNTLGHTLAEDADDPLLDARKDGVDYSYLSAHFGKRAQLYLAKKIRKSNHIFIITFFSTDDSSKILSMWSCDSNIFWKEVNRQEANKKKSGWDSTKPLFCHFSEKWLKLRRGKGAKLIFKNENI